MDEIGETCKLCLKYIQGNSVAALDEELLAKLEFIHMDLDRSVEESNSVCIDCKEKIQSAFDFKLCLVQSENSESGASGSQPQNVCDIPSTSSGESSTEKTICRLCKNSVAVISVISLKKLLTDDNVTEIFQGHIPEVELKVSENAMACEPCQKSLASFSILVSSWSIANDWNEDEDMKEDVGNFEAVNVKKENVDEFSDSNTNSSCTLDTSDGAKIVKKAKGNHGQINRVKTESNEVLDCSASASASNNDIKKEDQEEHDEGTDLQLKNEEVDIKDEEGSAMDTADEVENIQFTPPKKRPKRRHLDTRTKEMILNVYKHELENPGMWIKEIQRRVAHRTGVCCKTVFNVIREYKQTQTFSEPKRKLRYKQIVDSIEDLEKTAIRWKVYKFFFRNELPTVDKVLKKVNKDPDLPSFKRTTFWKLLKKLNFKCQNRGRNSMLVDKEEIVLWRKDYLKTIRKYRNEGRKIYYMDETCINAGHTKSQVRVDTSNSSSRLSTGLKNPSGKRKRLIICHIGSEDGFVQNALGEFESKKSGEYHDEMTGKSFEKWFSNTLPKLEDNCVVVLDNAPYHSRKVEKIPTTTSKKEEIRNWLLSKNIEFDDQMLKVELLAIVEEHKKQFDKLIIDEMAKGHNKTVLRLPPYHYELNPIELIWADVESYVADRNQTFKFSDMKNLFYEAVLQISPEKWQRSIDYIRQKVEQKMWELDHMIELQIEPLVITNGDSSSSISELESE